jgi:uncharacterized protein (TIGR00730 family)
MSGEPAPLNHVCVYCGSSNSADPRLIADAASLGRALAGEKLGLIYGGGGVGLMGACAQAAHDAGGQVLGVIPSFLTSRERPLDQVETLVVENMHQRKMIMYERSDGFVVLPGGIGTLEEVIELLSWRRLDLHAKPIVFYSPNGFWNPLFALFAHIVDQNLTPPDFMRTWRVAERVEDIIPTLRQMPEPTTVAPEPAKVD